MTKEQIDKEVQEYCTEQKCVLPKPWCYPGDLIFDTRSSGLFICGEDPKDVAELRKRNVSFLKVDVEELRQFLIERYA